MDSINQGRLQTEMPRKLWGSVARFRTDFRGRGKHSQGKTPLPVNKPGDAWPQGWGHAEKIIFKWSSTTNHRVGGRSANGTDNLAGRQGGS